MKVESLQQLLDDLREKEGGWPRQEIIGKSIFETIIPESARAAVGREENAGIVRAVLGGEKGPRRNVVLMNASAALVAAGVAPGLTEGIPLAAAIDSGKAARKLAQLVAMTNA